jgi:hypothetical protein
MRAQDSTPAWANKKGHKKTSLNGIPLTQGKGVLLSRVIQFAGVPASESVHKRITAFPIGEAPAPLQFCLSSAGQVAALPTQATASLIAICPVAFLPVVHGWVPPPLPRSSHHRGCHLKVDASLIATFLRSGASLIAISARHRITPRSSPLDFSCDRLSVLQSLIAKFMQAPGLPPAPRIGNLDGQTCWLFRLNASETRLATDKNLNISWLLVTSAMRFLPVS